MIKSPILGLVFYFQELTQPRGKRKAISLREALEKCSDRSGTHFDPSLVEILSNVIRLTEMSLMELPQKPTQLPNVWLEETVAEKHQFISQQPGEAEARKIMTFSTTEVHIPCNSFSRLSNSRTANSCIISIYFIYRIYKN